MSPDDRGSAGGPLLGREYPHELECGLPGFEAVDQPLARAEYHRVT